MIEPEDLVRPTRRQSHRIPRLTHRQCVLDIPLVRHRIRLHLLFDFVADDAAWHRRRNPHEFASHVADQLAAVHVRHGGLDDVPILDFEILALRRDAPAAHGRDPALRSEFRVNRAIGFAVAAQDLVDAALQPLHLAGRQHRELGFRIKHNGVGLVVVRRHWRVHLRAHPLRCACSAHRGDVHAGAGRQTSKQQFCELRSHAAQFFLIGRGGAPGVTTI